MRILVTNDDGVFAPGIGVMTDALIEAGHDVMVVAPLENHSGSSAATVLRHSIGAVSFKAVKLSAAPGARAIGVRALPSVCVSLALAGAFGPPADLVVSGINRGPNVGRFILHSGTVGAALTAAQQGRSAIAVGLRGRWTATMHYETAAAVAVALVEPLASMRAGTVLNCNVPDLELDMLRGVRRAELNMADVFHVERTGSRRVRVSFGFPGHATAADDDWALGADDFATLTAITFPAADPDPAVQAVVAMTVAQLDARFGHPEIGPPSAAEDIPRGPLRTIRRRLGGIRLRLAGVRRRLTSRVSW